MSVPATVPWIQWDEFVIGENMPDGTPDNDNRPVKFFLTQSDFLVTDPIPGFMARFVGTGDPNGAVTSPLGHAFVDGVGQQVWFKGTPSGNTGWFTISGGNLFGNGSPESVRSGPIGKFYEQRDASAVDHVTDPNVVDFSNLRNPAWVKRNLPAGTTVAMEWFNGGNDTNISGRSLDNGTTGIVSSGAWVIHPSTPAAQWDIVSSYGVPAANGYLYFNPPNLDSADYGTFIDGFTKRTSTLVHVIGVGVRFSAVALNGYIATVDLQNYQVQLYRVDAGALTSLAGPFSAVATAEGAMDIPFRLECRAIGSTIELFYNSARLLYATDATYSAQGVPVLYNNGAVAADGKLDHIGVKKYAYTATSGWFSENGFEYQGNLQIGTGSVAAGYDSPRAPGAGLPLQNIAFGFQAVATSSFSTTGGCMAFGPYSAAGGRESSAFGYNAQALADSSSSYGSTARAYGTYSSSFGFSSISTGTGAASFGVGAESRGTSAMAGGDTASAFGHWAVAWGPSSDAGGNYSTAWGMVAVAGHDNSMVFGTNAASFATNQLIFGGNPITTVDQNGNSVLSGGINTVLFGWGDTWTTSKSLTIRKTNGQGTDVAGGDFIFIAGKGTGSAAPGKFTFQVATAGASGTTLQTATTKFEITSTGIILSGLLTLGGIAYSFPASQSAGTFLTTDGSGNLSWSAITYPDQVPLTTKGDIFTFSTVDARLGVGTNGQVLTADSTQATGIKWATPSGGGSTSPLTTKGDVWGFSTVDARVPIGTNGQVLTADSAQALGLKWATIGTQAQATKTTTYTTTNADQTIFCDASGGAFTITLVTAVGNAGLRHTFKKIGTDFNVVTIDANSTETIDLALTYKIPVPGMDLVIESDGANWQVVYRFVPAVSCKAKNNAVQAYTTPNETAVAFQLEEWDTHAMHDNVTNNTRIKTPCAGRWEVKIRSRLANDATYTGNVFARRNGTASDWVAFDVHQESTGHGGLVSQAVSTFVSAKDDYYEMTMISSASQNIATFDELYCDMELTLIEPLV